MKRNDTSRSTTQRVLRCLGIAVFVLAIAFFAIGGGYISTPNEPVLSTSTLIGRQPNVLPATGDLEEATQNDIANETSQPRLMSHESAADDGHRSAALTLEIINPSRGYRPHSPEAAQDLRIAEKEVGFVCPPFRYPKGKSADSQAVSESIHKYSRYTKQYCNTTGVLQMQVPFDFYTSKVLTKIAALVEMKNGDRILDFGSGCGTMLNFFHLKFNTTGLGIDVTDEAVRHAMEHRQPRQLFCLMNAETQLVLSEKKDEDATKSAFYENSFDAIVSWGVLHHVRRTLSQCMIVHNLVKLLKPNGKAYIGHLRHDKNDFWRRGKCKINGTNIKRLRDGTTFKVAHWKKYDFSSLYIHKLA